MSKRKRFETIESRILDSILDRFDGIQSDMFADSVTDDALSQVLGEIVLDYLQTRRRLKTTMMCDVCPNEIKHITDVRRVPMYAGNPIRLAVIAENADGDDCALQIGLYKFKRCAVQRHLFSKRFSYVRGTDKYEFIQNRH